MILKRKKDMIDLEVRASALFGSKNDVTRNDVWQHSANVCCLAAVHSLKF